MMSVERGAGMMEGSTLGNLRRPKDFINHWDLTGKCNLLLFYTLPSSNLASVALLLHFRHQLISLTGFEGEKKKCPRRHWLEMNPDRDK